MIFLLPLNIMCILKFIQYLYNFFIRTNNILMRFNVVFCEGLQPQNVIIILFSMKHKYLLTAKTTDVNNSLLF